MITFSKWRPCLGILLFLVSSCSTASCPTVDFKKVIGGEIGQEIEIAKITTIKEAEAKSLNKMKEYPDIEQVPFGKINDKWIGFKSIKDGETDLVYFKTPKESWDALYGREGYALVRCGKVVDLFFTSMS